MAADVYMNQALFDDAVNDMAQQRELADLEERNDSEQNYGRPHPTRRTSVAYVESQSYLTEVLRKRDLPVPSNDGPQNKVSMWIQRLPSTRMPSRHISNLSTSSHWLKKMPRRPAPHSEDNGKIMVHLTPWEHVRVAYYNLIHQIDRSLPIIMPKARLKIIWDSFIMAFVIFSAVDVPLEVSYGVPTTMNILNYLNYAISFVFFIDICVNFRTAFINKQGYLIRDTDMIAKNYLSFWFPIDLAATIPYDLLFEAFGFNGSGGTQTTVLALLKLPRLLRLGRLVRLMEHVKNANIFKVVFLLLMMIMISHWLACIWYVMYKFSSFTPSVTDWAFDILNDGNVVSYYLGAYYQCFLLIVGNNQTPRNDAERVFFICVNILGTCFYSAVVGQMAVLVANMNTIGLRHKQKEDMTMDVLRYAGAPRREQKRVQYYFDYITQYNHPTNEGLQFLYDLPKALYQDVAGFLFRDALSKISIFKGLEASFITSVSLKMRIVMFTPKEVIFMAGDMGLDMYIIRKGYVAVVGKHNQLMSILGPGETFGEIALLTQAKRTAKCVALSNCDLCVLNSNDLKIIMKDYPSSAKQLEAETAAKVRALQVAGNGGFGYDSDEEDEYYLRGADKEIKVEVGVALPAIQEEEEGSAVVLCGSEDLYRAGSGDKGLQHQGSSELGDVGSEDLTLPASSRSSLAAPAHLSRGGSLAEPSLSNLPVRLPQPAAADHPDLLDLAPLPTARPRRMTPPPPSAIPRTASMDSMDHSLAQVMDTGRVYGRMRKPQGCSVVESASVPLGENTQTETEDVNLPPQESCSLDAASYLVTSEDVTGSRDVHQTSASEAACWSRQVQFRSSTQRRRPAGRPQAVAEATEMPQDACRRQHDADSVAGAAGKEGGGIGAALLMMPSADVEAAHVRRSSTDSLAIGGGGRTGRRRNSVERSSVNKVYKEGEASRRRGSNEQLVLNSQESGQHQGHPQTGPRNGRRTSILSNEETQGGDGWVMNSKQGSSAFLSPTMDMTSSEDFLPQLGPGLRERVEWIRSRRTSMSVRASAGGGDVSRSSTGTVPKAANVSVEDAIRSSTGTVPRMELPGSSSPAMRRNAGSRRCSVLQKAVDAGGVGSSPIFNLLRRGSSVSGLLKHSDVHLPSIDAGYGRGGSGGLSMSQKDLKLSSAEGVAASVEERLLAQQALVKQLHETIQRQAQQLKEREDAAGKLGHLLHERVMSLAKLVEGMSVKIYDLEARLEDTSENVSRLESLSCRPATLGILDDDQAESFQRASEATVLKSMKSMTGPQRGLAMSKRQYGSGMLVTALGGGSTATASGGEGSIRLVHPTGEGHVPGRPSSLAVAGSLLRGTFTSMPPTGTVQKQGSVLTAPPAGIEIEAEFSQIPEAGRGLANQRTGMKGSIRSRGDSGGDNSRLFVSIHQQDHAGIVTSGATAGREQHGAARRSSVPIRSKSVHPESGSVDPVSHRLSLGGQQRKSQEHVANS
ncbi:hypothetical protein CEUSTIGMA_g4702.t1 [Chlamydomonas eustigma]|uniref:Cyclic nucleotide-binding domain-containing protein n=1 Tax=Chlamydomonas eustigma TaxID=1157962 RepID=A0A250X2H5_9CHLO|nr:hypothetical protein CEUSTIGMA_g4702.t1 [Chlamydomonas eustigma]|eukprot:GAX77256.1 hypothetical protein CEUSTIGMA_g4702.t1 [Chlamydomonas eustigma]